jgi:hypothetical protein
MNNINKDKVLQIDPEYDDDSELIVKPLDIKTKDLSKGINEKFPQHPCTLYVPASRGGGKTTIFTYLLTHPYKKFFNRIYVFSASVKEDKAWKKLKLDGDRVFTSYSDAEFQAVIDEIRDAPDEKALIIIDDMTGTSIMTKNNALTRFLFIHRHVPNDDTGTSLWIASHQYKSVSPNVRNNFTDVIILASFSNTELTSIADDNKGDLTYKDFFYLYKICTNPKYNFMYIKRGEEEETRFRRNFNTILKLKYVPINEIDRDELSDYTDSEYDINSSDLDE